MTARDVADPMPDRRPRWARAIRLLAACGATFQRRAPRPAGPDDMPAPSTRAWDVKRLLANGSPEAVLLDTRRGVALIVAYRALAAAADKRATTSERLSDQAESAYRRSVARGR